MTAPNILINYFNNTNLEMYYIFNRIKFILRMKDFSIGYDRV
jgi:hypothetical protein